MKDTAPNTSVSSASSKKRIIHPAYIWGGVVALAVAAVAWKDGGGWQGIKYTYKELGSAIPINLPTNKKTFSKSDLKPSELAGLENFLTQNTGSANPKTSGGFYVIDTDYLPFTNYVINRRLRYDSTLDPESPDFSPPSENCVWYSDDPETNWVFEQRRKMWLGDKKKSWMGYLLKQKEK